MAWRARLCTIAGAIYNTRNRLASLEIIRIRRLRDEVGKLVAAQDATDFGRESGDTRSKARAVPPPSVYATGVASNAMDGCDEAATSLASREVSTRES
jgi:hypothetical protein